MQNRVCGIAFWTKSKPNERGWHHVAQKPLKSHSPKNQNAPHRNYGSRRFTRSAVPHLGNTPNEADPVNPGTARPLEPVSLFPSAGSLMRRVFAFFPVKASQIMRQSNYVLQAIRAIAKTLWWSRGFLGHTSSWPCASVCGTIACFHDCTVAQFPQGRFPSWTSCIRKPFWSRNCY